MERKQRKHWSAKLSPLGACNNAVAWAATQPSATVAWRECKRGDWMLWLCGKLSGEPESESRRKLVLAACACARLSLHHVKASEFRPLRAIETAEAWARGDAGVTLEEVRTAAYAAAYLAAYAAAYAKCADIVRAHYPKAPRLP